MPLKISIVVPNFNSEKTLRRTLNSLVSQNCESLEIIVVDGGSSDSSLEIIKEFGHHIHWWVSEPDLGQSNAINKGFSHCTGDIINWICSDDVLSPNALEIINQMFSDFPDIDVLVGAGSVQFTEANFNPASKHSLAWLKSLQGRLGWQTPGLVMTQPDSKSPGAFIKHFRSKDLALMPAYCSISQPSCFYRRALLDRNPPIDETYNFALDTELWNYFKSKGVKWHCIDDVLSISFQDGKNKTSTGGYKVALELEEIYKTYSRDLVPLTFWQKKFRYPLEKFIMKNPGRKIQVILASGLWVGISLILAPFYGVRKVKAMRWTKWV